MALSSSSLGSTWLCAETPREKESALALPWFARRRKAPRPGACAWAPPRARSLGRSTLVRISSSSGLGSWGASDDDEAEEDVGDDVLNEAIAKSRRALARQKDLLRKIVEKREVVSSIKDSLIDVQKEVLSSADNFSSSNQYFGLTANDQDSEESKNQIKFNVYHQLESETPVSDALGLLREANLKTKSLTGQMFSEGTNLSGVDSEIHEITEAVEDKSRHGNSSEKRNTASPPLAGVNVMNVVLVAAECAPWSKTGGLGDVASALPKALARRGHRVMVVAPRYGNYSEPQEIGECKHYSVDGHDMEVRYFHAYIDGVDFVFLDNPIFQHRENNIYGGERLDILRRMVLFCKAAAEVPWHVPCGGVCYGDGNLIFIANDWHSALLPVYLKAYYRDKGYMKYARSILVIHNIAHQGRGPMDDVKHVDLPGHYHDIFRHHDPLGGEHFNIFAAGLKCADRIVSVSHGYLWELKTAEGGWGLHQIINDNGWKLHGIVNGIDTNEWNPELDAHLMSDGYSNYTLESLKTGKSQCKAALQRELGLPVREEVPLIGFIGRLDHQKGVDIIAEAIPWMVGNDMQLIMLGSGRHDLEQLLRKFESQYRDKVRGWVGFSVRTAHRITAGCDILLMPSRFEPCGLNQLYAMKYGTIPVVHAVGGLRDTVQQFDPFNEAGTGWTFDHADAGKLIEALGHCLNTYWNYKKSWEGLQRRGMSQDLSWDNAAQQYEDVLVNAKFQW